MIHATTIAVANAQTIQQLCDALNSFEPDFFGQRLEDVVDLCGLPTFGGEAPADTSGIWSWNPWCLLCFDVGTSVYYISSRKED